MKKQARLVIIGAGIVGCSAAYHLARLGWRDIIVVDQGPLFATGGSTTHSPGLITQAAAQPLMGRLAQQTTRLLQDLGPDDAGEPYFYPVGSVEVAQTKARQLDLQQRLGWSLALGLEARLLSPAEVKQFFPLLNEQVILGGLHTATDGYARAWAAAGAMAAAAEATGAVTFYPHVKVTELVQQQERIVGIETQKGRITGENVLLCTNIWAPVLANQVGLALPMRAVEHQYVISRPLPALQDAPPQPTLRHRDFGLYFRRHGSAYGVGSYHHEPHVVSAYDIGIDAKRPFTLEDFIPAQRAANELLPPLAEHGFAQRFNGLMAFSVDGLPILGPSRLPGLWLATAISVTHAGGAGQLLAEWLVQGAPSHDVSPISSQRFHAHQRTPGYIKQSCAAQYRQTNAHQHPRQSQTAVRDLRLAPFHQRLVSRSAVFAETAGWEVAQWYEANERLLATYGPRIPARGDWAAAHWSAISGAEHLAVRDHVGLFNLNHHTRIEVSGPDALPFLTRLTTGDLHRPVGSAQATLLLNARGGIQARVTAIRKETDCFWLTTAAPAGPLLLAWLRRHLPDRGVNLRDLSSPYAGLGLWGPRAGAVLEKVAHQNVSLAAFPPNSARELSIQQIPVQAIRHTQIGEDGWALYCPSEMGLRLWDSLWSAGQAHQLISAGARAFESLRIEHGWRRWGVDITSERTPAAAGLNHLVDPTKDEFLGQTALTAPVKTDTHLCRLRLQDLTQTPLGGETVLNEHGAAIGRITSADFAYSLGYFTAYAYLPAAAMTVGTPVQIFVLGDLVPAVVATEVGK